MHGSVRRAARAARPWPAWAGTEAGAGMSETLPTGADDLAGAGTPAHGGACTTTGRGAATTDDRLIGTAFLGACRPRTIEISATAVPAAASAGACSATPGR